MFDPFGARLIRLESGVESRMQHSATVIIVADGGHGMGQERNPGMIWYIIVFKHL